jgi:hypothetical protein
MSRSATPTCERGGPKDRPAAGYDDPTAEGFLGVGPLRQPVDD